MEELTIGILSGIAWDAMKNGIKISTNYIKNKLSNWILDDEKLEEISVCMQNIPDTYCISEGMLREYFNLNKRLLDILEETKQNGTAVSQKIKANNGIVIANNSGTINFSGGIHSDIDKKN